MTSDEPTQATGFSTRANHVALGLDRRLMASIGASRTDQERAFPIKGSRSPRPGDDHRNPRSLSLKPGAKR